MDLQFESSNTGDSLRLQLEQEIQETSLDNSWNKKSFSDFHQANKMKLVLLGHDNWFQIQPILNIMVMSG